jgi:hypothetical protein
MPLRHALRVPLAVVLIGFGVQLHVSRAAAYCRTTTVDMQQSTCPDVCNVGEGIPLAWSVSDVDVFLNERGFPGLSDAQARQILASAFDAWNDASCDGDALGMRATLSPKSTSLEVGPEQDEPNENVIVHFDAEAWDEQGLSPMAFALTSIWYDSATGRILGADMHFNGGMDPFELCPDEGCVNSTDLLNVATHEAGHFFGLGHSDVPNSTMWCDAAPDETLKRTLANDDVDGICDIYGPDAVFVDDARDSKRCSALPFAGSGLASFGWLGLLGLAFGLRRQKR